MSSPPVKYTPATDFSDYATAHPADPLPGTNVDAEYAAIKVTTDKLVDRLGEVQRDDGRIRNQTVHKDALSTEVRGMIAADGATPRGAWVTATSYAAKDLVSQDDATYICVTAHTSGTFATDLAAGKWLFFADAVAANIRSVETYDDLRDSDITDVMDDATVVAVGGAAEAADQRGGLFVHDPSDTASTDDGGTTLVSGTKRFKRFFHGRIGSEWFSLSESTLERANNAAKLVKIYAAAAAQREHIFIEHGTFPLQNEHTLPRNINLIGRNPDRTCFDWNGAPAGNGSYPTFSCLTTEYEFVDLGGLPTDKDADAVTIDMGTLPASVVEGSIVFLVDKASGSFNGDRPYYYKGEAVTVLKVDGSVITFSAPLRHGYPAATTKVSLLVPTRSKIEGITFRGRGVGNVCVPLRFVGSGPTAEINGIVGHDSDNAGIELQYCIGLTGNNVVGRKLDPDTLGLSYGLVMSSCQDITINSGEFYGDRHGIAIGGADSDYAIVSRNVKVRDAKMSCVPGSATAVSGWDVHGNGVDCWAYDCTIIGGALVGGADNGIRGGKIISGTQRGLPYFAVKAGELKSTHHTFENIDIDIYNDDTFPEEGGALAVGNNTDSELTEHTTEGGVFAFRNNNITFSCNGGSEDFYNVVIRNNGSAATDIDFDISNNQWNKGAVTAQTAGRIVVHPADNGGARIRSVSLDGNKGFFASRILQAARISHDGCEADATGLGSIPNFEFDDVTVSASFQNMRGLGGSKNFIKTAQGATKTPAIIMRNIYATGYGDATPALAIDINSGGKMVLSGYQLLGTYGAVKTLNLTSLNYSDAGSLVEGTNSLAATTLIRNGQIFGTWTPVLTAATPPTTPTISYATARYMRDGRKVTLWFQGAVTNVGSGGSGQIRITGLPYSVSKTVTTSGRYQNVTLGSGYEGIHWELASGGSIATLWKNGTGVVSAALNWADLAATVALNFFVEYETDDA